MMILSLRTSVLPVVVNNIADCVSSVLRLEGMEVGTVAADGRFGVLDVEPPGCLHHGLPPLSLSVERIST
jgi:hypothetical protein